MSRGPAKLARGELRFDKGFLRFPLSARCAEVGASPLLPLDAESLKNFWYGISCTKGFFTDKGGNMKYKMHYDKKISLLNCGLILILIGLAVFGYKAIIKRVQKVTSEVCIVEQDG